MPPGDTRNQVHSGFIMGHESHFSGTVQIGDQLSPEERLKGQARMLRELGLKHLQLRNYRNAISAFDQAIQTADVSSEVYFHRALAKLNSRGLRRLTPRQAASIDRDLAAASAEEIQGHHLFLRLLLRRQFYQKRRITAPPPCSADITRDLQSTGVRDEQWKLLLTATGASRLKSQLIGRREP